MVKTCGKCGDEYEAYSFVVTNNLSALLARQEIEDEYGNVCESCRKDEMAGGWATL